MKIMMVNIDSMGIDGKGFSLQGLGFLYRVGRCACVETLCDAVFQFPLSTCFHISSFQVYHVPVEKLLAAIMVYVIFSSGSAVVMKAFREMTVQVIWDRL